MEGTRIPAVTFKCRVGDDQSITEGGCGFIGGEFKDYGLCIVVLQTI